jgi:hypothetical protein
MTYADIKIKLSISVVIRHIIISNFSPFKQSELYALYMYMYVYIICTVHVGTVYIRCVSHNEKFLTIKKTSWLKLCVEMMATYCENHTEHRKTPYRQTADIWFST